MRLELLRFTTACPTKLHSEKDHMKKMKEAKYLIAAAFIFVLLASITTPVFASSTTKFSLALAENQIKFDIPAGTDFNGTIQTTGMVRFWVTAPDEAQIVNLGIIDKSASFHFTSHENGTYTFNFENDLPNTISVTFTYDTNPPLPSGNSAIPYTYWIAVIAVAIGGSALIIFTTRRRNKKFKETQKHP